MINIRNITGNLRLGELDFRAFSLQNEDLPKRELERKGTRFLLENLFPGRAVTMSYTPNNKPFLVGLSEHISVSHSHDKLVVLVNTVESTGVDVELIRDKVINIRHKYLNADELRCAGENIELLITLWAAKEAIYKAYGLKEVDFARHMSIETETLSGENFYGRLHLPHLSRRYSLKREKLDNYILVYILNEV